MPDWLFEGLWAVYATLGMVAVVLLILWWRDRRRGWLYGIAVAGLLILIYALLDFAVETDGEQIGRELQEMARAVRNRDLNGALVFFSDRFVAEGHNKAAFQQMAEPYVRNGTVTDVVIWDFHFNGKTKDAPPIANVNFRVKLKGNLGSAGEYFALCEAQFEQEPNKVWRLRGFRLFDPMKNDEPIHLP